MKAYDADMRALAQFSQVVALLAAVLAATPSVGETEAAHVQVVSVTVDPVYHSLLIPEASGWLGSDAAHSIPISSTRSIWLFGDTLIGTIRNGQRSTDFDFINGTVGIHYRSGPIPGSMKFFWNRNTESALSFFPHQEGTAGDFYWTTMGMMLEGELFIYAFPINMGTADWINDTTLIRVSNPHSPPTDWEYTIHDLGIGDTHQGFHSAIHIEEPYVYFLGYDDPEEDAKRRRTVLARVLISDVIAGRLGEAYEYWCESENGGVWKNEPVGLKSLFVPGVTETGIHYIEEWDVFVCPTYEPRSEEILLTVARDITGPWSEPVSIYRIPEHDVPFPIISYAVRPHPELSTEPGEVILTYNTNAVGSTDPLFSEEGYKVYWPRFLRVRLERE